MKLTKKMGHHSKAFKRIFLLITFGCTLALFLYSIWFVNQYRQSYLRHYKFNQELHKKNNAILNRGSLFDQVYLAVSGKLKPTFERKALKSYEIGSTEKSKFNNKGSKEYYHFIQSLIIKKTCLKSQAFQGYNVDDNHWVISTLNSTQKQKEITNISQRLIIWLLGMVGIFFSFNKLKRREKKKWNQAEADLIAAYQNTEKILLERNENLSNKNLLLDLILNSMEEGIYVIDLNGISAFVNKSAAKMLGFEVNELLNIQMHKILHYKKADGSAYEIEECPIYKSLTEGKELIVKDDIFWRKDGTSFHVKYTSTPIIYNGKILGAVVVFSDITEFINLENKLREELKVSKTLIDCLPGVFYLYDNKFNFLMWNKRFEEVTGYSTEEISKMTPLDFFPDDHKKLIAEKIGSVLTLGYNEVEADFLTKSGKRIPYFFNGQKIELEGQECLIGVGIDLTELNKAKEEIKKLNKELEQKIIDRTAKLIELNKELESFSYSVSHDLKAPLRHISGFIELLNTKYSHTMDEKAKRYLNIIHESASRMSLLIDDLLSFSRISRSTASKSRVNTNELVKSVLYLFDEEIKKRNIKIIVFDLPEVYADPPLIKQVWINLISNAVKYTNKVEKPTIEIGSSMDENYVTYYVKDNGAGFDMEYYDKLFGVFQRLHGSDQFEGTGIGLATVKKIIDKQNGKVWAEGKVNEGSTFYFSLPRKVD